jgi:hypothetical protein
MPTSLKFIAAVIVAIGFGACDSILIALSRLVVRRGKDTGKRGIAITLAALYLLIITPSVLTNIAIPLLHPDQYDWTGAPVAPSRY